MGDKKMIVAVLVTAVVVLVASAKLRSLPIVSKLPTI